MRHIGVSNFPSKLVNEAQETTTIFANQVEYHPYLGQKTLLEQARAQDYMLTAYSPIAQGKVTDDETLETIGEAHGKSPVQVTLRWLGPARPRGRHSQSQLGKKPRQQLPDFRLRAFR